MNQMLFGAMPYILLTIAIVGTIWRFTTNKYSWSSQSSQFLENKTLFFGSFPWHYGIITLLLGHFIGFIVPSAVLAWNGVPIRLYILELTGLAFGFLALFGLLALIYRRLTNARVKALTSGWDVLILIVLLIQVVTGLGNAIVYRWGSNWYAASAVPWMWSVLSLNPRLTRCQPAARNQGAYLQRDDILRPDTVFKAGALYCRQSLQIPLEAVSGRQVVQEGSAHGQRHTVQVVS